MKNNSFFGIEHLNWPKLDWCYNLQLDTENDG